MTEPATTAIEGVGFGLVEPACSQPIPQIEPGPLRCLQNLIAVRRQERVGEKDRHLLLTLAVEQAQAPGDWSAGFVETPIEFGACGPMQR